MKGIPETCWHCPLLQGSGAAGWANPSRYLHYVLSCFVRIVPTLWARLIFALCLQIKCVLPFPTTKTGLLPVLSPQTDGSETSENKPGHGLRTGRPSEALSPSAAAAASLRFGLHLHVLHTNTRGDTPTHQLSPQPSLVRGEGEEVT